MEVGVGEITIFNGKRKRLTNEQRHLIANMLCAYSVDGDLKRGSLAMVAAEFSVSKKTILRIWKQVKNCFRNHTEYDVSNRLIGNVGRKRVQIDLNKVCEILLRQRTNIRSLSHALNMPKSTVHRRIKEGLIRRHSNALKPTLNDENKKARLDFCVKMLEPSSLNNNPTFKGMFDYIHIDEKWFYMTKDAQKYYLHPEEENPIRTCKSKRFIPKIMFLAAVARPRFDSLGNELFSGKIGIFPFIFKEPAKRRSKNRVAGTLETKPIVSITKDVLKECLIQKVLPAIRAKWPNEDTRRTIFIQQDNARPHTHSDDAQFVEAASVDGFNIRLGFQPPNSPDLNVLDLGFFRAIQSLQYQEAPNTIDELVYVVEKAFHDLSSDSLNRVFLTLQGCMKEIIKVRGGNNYHVPHMGKDRLQREGNLPLQLEIDADILESALVSVGE